MKTPKKTDPIEARSKIYFAGHSNCGISSARLGIMQRHQFKS